jgi:phasin family protein
MEKIMSQSKLQMDKMTQDASAFGKEGMEAFMQSSAIFAKGFEEITRTAMALCQSSAEKQAQFFNQALSSKTLNEWTEAQNKIAQSNMDDIMSAATKLSEMSIKVLTESAEPINEQMGKGIRKASESMAA